MLTALTFNVLAPNYAAPKYYPPIDNIYLSRHFRRSATTKFLNNIKSKCDIIALQEVTHDTIINDEICHIRIGEYNYFNDLLSDDFIGTFVPHDKSYWSNYFDKNNENYAYIQNGNALFLRKSVFSEITWYDVPLTTGNHAVSAIAIYSPTKRFIHILNVHFENLNENTRFIELSAALKYRF